jgi:hypothetical protein
MNISCHASFYCELDGACSTNVKPKGKRLLGRSRRRWLNNIEMDLGGIEWSGVDWIGLAQNRDKWRALVNALMKLKVPWNAGKLSSGYTTGGLSNTAEPHTVS